LEHSADDLGAAGYDPSFGYGRVNAFRAISSAGGGSSASTVATAGTVAPAVNKTSQPASAPSFPVPKADAIAPTVTIFSAPANNARLTNAVVSLAGSANDNVAVARVEVRVNNGQTQVAQGTKSWTSQVALAAGQNVVHIRSFDTSGNASAET